jgi:cell wall-associated NlpC family hydrolase
VSSRRALAAGAALLMTAGLLAAAPTANAAPSLTDAKKQAAQLSAQVDRLTTQAEVASENYDAAEESLGTAATTYLGVEAQLENAQAQDAADSNSIRSQASAIYEAGGPAPLYAEALNGDDLGDVMDRMTMAGNVLRSQQLAAAGKSGLTAQLSSLNSTLAKAATTKSRLEAQASRTARQVKDLLAQQKQLLAQANVHVKQVLYQLQQAAEKAAAAKFARELKAAQELAAAQQAVLGGATAPTAAAGAAVAAAASREGTPYQWGATGPGSFDCSGLTGWAYAQAGIGLPRTSREQWFVGHHVGLADLQPGDLLFWATDANNPATIHHVAIYAGNGYMIAAPHSGANVSLQRVYLNGYIGATRPTG